MKFLKERPALLLEELDKRTLVIADLHLGLEYEIYKKGISIPPRVDKQKERINDLVEETKAEGIILLGDVKHNVPRTSISEKERLPEFFKELSEKVDVTIVKGNHDGNIEKLVEETEVEVTTTKGFKEDRFYFNHGQSWPGEEIKKSKILLRGHSHPAVEFEDSLGFSSTVPCWIRGPVRSGVLEEKYVDTVKLEEIIILPAFNQLITGMPMNKEKEKKLLGPILENGAMDIDESKVHLLDSTYIGKLEDL
ncbi:MAG: metallophosphoesterase [Candidatus Aenigmatarchaeota archaeon]